MKIKCPLCKSTINMNFDEYAEGDTIECPHCNRELLIVTEETGIVLHPIKDEDEENLEEMGFYEDFDE